MHAPSAPNPHMTRPICLHVQTNPPIYPLKVCGTSQRMLYFSGTGTRPSGWHNLSYNNNWRSNFGICFISFFVVLILFDLYILQSFFRSTFSFVPSYLHIYTDIGRPKKCRNIYKLNKYKNKIYTTKQFIC